MCFSILMPLYMVPTWSYISSSLPHLPIMSWRFRISPIKVSCYSQSRLFSSCSQWFYLCNKSVVSYPHLLSDISYGEGSVKGTVLLVVFNTPPFDILMPSDNIISVWLSSASRTWNIFSHRPRVYDNSGIPLKLLILYDVAPLNTGWKKADDRRLGDDGSITTHSPSFPPGISFPDLISRVCDAVLYSSTKNIQNLTPPSTDPLHIPLLPT